MFDLLFETNVGRSEGMNLFLSCAWTEVIVTNLFDKHLAHIESLVNDRYA